MQMLSEKDLKNLSAESIANSKTLIDASGMYVFARTSAKGSNNIFFKMRYRDAQNKRAWLTIGKYPEMDLTTARLKYSLLIDRVRAGEDPIIEDQSELDKTQVVKTVTLGQVWREWRAAADAQCAIRTSQKYASTWRTHLYKLQDVPLAKITAQSVMSFLRPYLQDQNLATAQRLGAQLKTCLDYAVFTNQIQANPINNISHFLPKTDGSRHFASFGYEDLEQSLKDFFNAIRGTNELGEIMIHFTFYTLLRHLEVRSLTLDQLNDNYAYIKTKTLGSFKVAFSKQAQQILEYMKAHHKSPMSRYVFEGRVGGMPSEGAMRACLEKSGYAKKFTVHGIRACGRQWLQTLPDAKESIIEQCLSHVVGSRTEQAYNRGDYFTERLRIMQKWSDFVERCIGDNNKFYLN